MPKQSMIAWALAGGWMAVIFILSHQPASVSSGLSSEITEFLMDLFKGIFRWSDAEIEGIHTLVRKNAHFIAYFILGILLLNAIRKNGNLQFRYISLAFAVSVLYAISDEIHQLFIDGRSGEIRDVLIDSAGAAAGIAAYCLIFRLSEKRKNRKTSTANKWNGKERDTGN